VRETGSIVVAFGHNEDLGLVLKSPKGSGVEDAISITLKRSAIVRLIFLELAAARIATPVSIRCEGLGLEFFQSFARDHGRLSLMIAAVDVNKG
jgi:hypothetical protein